MRALLFWFWAWVGSAHATPDAEDPPQKLVVGTTELIPFIFQQNGEIQGFSVDLWDAVAHELGVEYELVEVNSVNTLSESVRLGVVDLAISGIIITGEREERLDFTHPYHQAGLQIMVREREGAAPFQLINALLSPNLLRIFIAGFVIILISAHFMWLAERHVESRSFPIRYRHGIWETVWWAVVTVTTVGYGDKIPNTIAGRLVAMGWMWMGIILFSFFIGTVTSELTVERLQGHIASPGDLPGRDVATVRGSLASAYLRDRAVIIYEVGALQQAYEALETGEVEAIVYDAPVLQYYASHRGRGRVKVVGPVFRVQNYAITLPQGSPLREPINRALLQIQEDERYELLHQKWFGN